MKKRSKLLALLLTLCILATAVLVLASASDSDAAQLKPEAAFNAFADYDGTRAWSGSKLGDHYVSETVTDVRGNKYMRVGYADGSKSVEDADGTLSLPLYTKKNAVTEYGFTYGKAIQHLYASLDFDFTPDRYVVKGDGTYTTYAEDALPEGVSPSDDNVDPSVIDGTALNLTLSYWQTNPETLDTQVKPTSSRTVGIYIVKDEETDKWYWADKSTFAAATKKVEMSEDPGVFDHVTVVFYTRVNGDGQHTVMLSFFVNGEFLYNKSSVPFAENATAITLTQLSLSVNKSVSAYDSYSYGIDNMTLNYYGLDYSSGDDYGIEDIYDKSKMSVEEQIDTVYSRDYVMPNGYVQVINSDGARAKETISSVIANEYNYIDSGTVIKTNRDLIDLTVPSGVTEFTVECDPDKYSVKLAASAEEAGYVAVKTETGYKVTTSNPKLEWYNSNGDLLLSETVKFGDTPNTENADLSTLAYIQNDELYTETNIVWGWDLEGEVGEITTENAEKGQTIKLTPSASTKTKIEGASFVMGKLANDGATFIPAPASDGTYTFYADATGDQLLTECITLKYGNTCKLLRDFTGYDGDAAAISATSAPKLKAGKTLNLDLNGHKLAKVGKLDTDDNYIFYITDKLELNIFSSKAGGVITNAILRTHIKRLDSVHSNIVGINGDSHGATVNFGDYKNADGKVIFDGDNLSAITGTLVYVRKYDTVDLGKESININISGGEYYLPFRAQTALITLRACNTKINIDGIASYGSGLVYEYSGNATDGTEVTVKNSEVYASTIIQNAQYGDYYFENNKLFASGTKFINGYDGGTFTLGPGNTLAGAYNKSDLSHFGYADGVEYLLAENETIDLGSETFTLEHLALGQKWADALEVTYSDDFDGTINDQAEAEAVITSVKLKSDFFDVTKTTSYTGSVRIITFTEDTAPEIAKRIEWRGADGQIKDVSFGYVGQTITAPLTVEDAGYADAECGWYISKYEWKNSASEDMTVKESGNLIVGSPFYVAEISGIKANMMLADGMVFNLYLPVPDGNTSDINVTNAVSSGVSEVNGLGSVYAVSVASPLDSFAPVTVTLNYTVNGNNLSYDIAADVLKYASIVAKSYACGTDEAELAYRLVSYKEAVTSYLEKTTSEDEAKAIRDFKALYSDHTLCECTEAFDESSISSAEKNVTYETALSGKVLSVSYQLKPEALGIIIETADGITVKGVTYKDLSGAEKNLSITEVDGKYIASGLSAANVKNILTINVASGDSTYSGTYSLGRYILNNTTCALAKSLYQYSMAAKNYKQITKEDERHTVSFDANGGTSVSDIAVIYGRPATEPAAPEKLGCRFAGWTLDGEAYDFSLPVTEDITLVATYERLEDTEIYNDGELQSVLLIGQSNMVGRGDPRTVDPIEDDRLLMFRGDRWWKMQEPLHTNTNISGTGLAASFGKAFVETFDCELGLIPGAKGSSTIDMWAVGSDYYNEAVRLAKEAKKTSNICAIIWHQGESGGNASDYAAKLEVVLKSMIEEIGLDPEKIVVLTGEIFEERSGYVAHSNNIHSLYGKFEHYGVAKSTGLSVIDVTTHFDAWSLRVFGYRFFEQFYKIVTDKTYEFDNDPEHYKVWQDDYDPNVNIIFDDMALGVFGTPYPRTISGTGRVSTNTSKGKLEIFDKDQEGIDRYARITNNTNGAYVLNSVVTMYDPVAEESFSTIDCVNNLFAMEMDVRLNGTSDSGTAYLLELFEASKSDQEEARTIKPVIMKNNAIYACGADGSVTDTKVCDLSGEAWTNVRVVFDVKGNSKDIYVNGTLVCEDLPLSSAELTDFAPTSFYLVHYNGKTAGTVEIDNFKSSYVAE